MTDIRRLHRKWSADAAYRKAYDDLGAEFAVAQAMVEARQRAGLTQAQVAKKIKTTQSVVARLESGRALPSGRTLQRYAEATRSRLVLRFEPLDA